MQRILTAIIFAIAMGFFMSLTVTFAITVISFGFDSNFIYYWMSSWLKIYPIAFASILAYRPAAIKITEKTMSALMKKFGTHIV